MTSLVFVLICLVLIIALSWSANQEYKQNEESLERWKKEHDED